MSVPGWKVDGEIDGSWAMRGMPCGDPLHYSLHMLDDLYYKSLKKSTMSLD